jgi:hypothetical protein
VSTLLKVYTDEDDALLFWSVPSAIPNCRGFAVARRRKAGRGKLQNDFLTNRIGFEKEPAPAKPVAGAEAVTKPSTEWPFQRFSWTDHDANTGDTVSYQVIPVVRSASGRLELLTDQQSAWSPSAKLGSAPKSPFRPFFNRGFVISQFMARFLAQRHLSLSQFKKAISDENDLTIRTFLSGDLRLALLAELKTALKDGGEVFAALFELSDQELIDALCGVGAHAHVVLANGSITKTKTETSAQARTRDENADGRAALEAAGVDVEASNRFLSPGALGHNKFLVRTDKDGKPVTAWTGSTNWTPTGLCTQVNNGLLIEDPAVAQVYLDQWHRLRNAGSTFPAVLVAENSKPKLTGADTPGTVRSAVWFTRTSKGVDMDALRAEVNKARQGILFLMFMPGGTGLFSTVAARSAEPNLYVRGVVSELPGGPGDESAVDVSLVKGATHTSLHLTIIQPEGVAHPFATFAQEVTHKQFIASIGHAIIHSKVVVMDPFSPDPVVITGSHNFSTSASAQNDENFIIVRGDHQLAEAYAVNILAAYQHYRWRAFLGQTSKPFNGLKDNDTWLPPMLAGDRGELAFWGV